MRVANATRQVSKPSRIRAWDGEELGDDWQWSSVDLTVTSFFADMWPLSTRKAFTNTCRCSFDKLCQRQIDTQWCAKPSATTKLFCQITALHKVMNVADKLSAALAPRLIPIWLKCWRIHNSFWSTIELLYTVPLPEVQRYVVERMMCVLHGEFIVVCEYDIVTSVTRVGLIEVIE